MTPKITKETNGSLTLSINLELSGTMLEQEEQIARAVAEVGRMATGEALGSFDTDGAAVVVDNRRYTSKGTQKKSTRRRTE